MKNEILLISEDKATAEREIAKLQSYTGVLNELQGVYETLDLGRLDDEKTALSLLTDKGNTVSEIFLRAIAADALSTGSKNKHFVSQQVNSQQETVKNFKTEVSLVLDQTEKYFNFSMYNYSEQAGYFISEPTKELIVERNKKYLSDPAEIEIYKEFKKIFMSLQNLDRLITKRTGKNSYYSLAPYFESVNYQNHTTQFFDANKILELLGRNR
jgi:hypothetical protein